MPRRTQAESEQTAEAVLASATELYGRHGFAGVGLDQVAGAAGVTRGAVYHHFGDRRGLFGAVAARLQAGVGAAVVAAAEAEADPWSGLEAGCRAYLEAVLAPAVRRTLLLEAPAVLGWEAWRDQDAAGPGHHLEEALAELDAAGLLAPVSVAATAVILNGALNDAALWVAADPAGTRLDEAWTTLLVLLRALRPEGAPVRD